MVFLKKVLLFLKGKINIYRFKWVLKKCLEYIKFKIPELVIKNQFLQLMMKIEKKNNLIKKNLYNGKWLERQLN